MEQSTENRDHESGQRKEKFAKRNWFSCHVGSVLGLFYVAQYRVRDIARG